MATSKCGTCGHEWTTGTNGDHSCAERLLIRIADLEQQLDPPVCRLQFPDGTVPGNVREAADGWHRVATDLTNLVNKFENWADEMPCLPFNLQNRDIADRLGELREWDTAFHEWRDVEPEVT